MFFYRHPREGGDPGHSADLFLDSRLRENDEGFKR